MNKFKLAFALMLLIILSTAWHSVHETSGAKRKHVNPEHTRTNIVVTMHIFSNRSEFETAIKPYLTRKEKNYHIEGFSRWWMPDKDGNCEIYVLKAREEEDFEVWGHELAHCVYGRWHKE